MNIILLEGDDFEKIYDRLNSFVDSAKKRNWEINRISTKSSNIVSQLNANSLFGIKSLYIISEPDKLSASDLDWFSTSSKNNEGILIIVKEGKLASKIKGVIPINKHEEFWVPQTIWKTLDAFYPGNSSNFINLLKQTSDNMSTEFLFAMLGRHALDLYQVLVDVKSFKAPQWKVNKLKLQAMKFEPKVLKSYIAEMAKMDSVSKSTDLKLIDLLTDASIVALNRL